MNCSKDAGCCRKCSSTIGMINTLATEPLEVKMDCLRIITDYLKANGFDGLQKEDQCGCEISDLVPCCNDFSSCTPGYKVIPPTGTDCEFDFYICPNKTDKPWELE